MKRINWDLRLRVINNELDQMLRYITLLEDVSKSENDKLFAQIDEEMELNKLSEEDKIWWPQEMYGSRISEINHDIPQMMWYGVFVSLMSYYEQQMLYLARLHRFRNLRNLVSSLPSWLLDNLDSIKYTEHAVKYWKSVGFELPKKGPQWKEIQIYQKLRNQIVHEGGEQDDTQRSIDISEYIMKRTKNSLSLGSKFGIGQSLVMTPDFCRESIETIRFFFNSFVADLP